ncbi:MAG: c-type cytochrome domain-containing protein [Akkermansiaceae bacterium]
MSEETQTPEEALETPNEGKVGLIFLSLFILVLVGALVFLGLKGGEGELGNFLTNDGIYNEVFGNMHPLVLHLPIGIVFLTVVMEGLGWISFGKYRPVTTVGLFLAILTGAIACVTGFVDMHMEYNPQSETWNDHMWAGIGFVGVLSLAFLSRIWNPEKGGRNPVYAILLLAAAGVMGFGSHIGGEEIHGELGLEKAWNEFTQKGEAVADSDEDKVPVVIKAPKDRLAYADVIVPIIANRCLKCHDPAQKVKSGLEMHTWEGLIKGGDTDRALVPGDVKKSYMVEVLFLDEDDDMFMPPPSKKREPMPDHEREIIKWWAGALPKSDILEDKTLAEMGAPAEILEAAARLVPPEQLAEMEAQKAAAAKAMEDEQRKKREALDSALGALKQDEQLKNAINYVSQDSTDLEFTAVSLRKEMRDEHFEKLAPVSEALTSLRLGASSVSEAALQAHLGEMRNLRQLDLNQTGITDAGLDVVASLENLEWLNLYGTAVTDAGLAKLKSLTKLKKLYLWNSKATPVGADALKKELPELEIIFGAN